MPTDLQRATGTFFDAERLRAERRGAAGPRWLVGETCVKVAGRWCYLCRAIDREGNLVGAMLGEQRDMAARFCADFEEQRQHSRPRARQYERVTLADQRHQSQER